MPETGRGPRKLLEQIPAGTWAVVMGCGIVSADLLADRQPALSGALLWFAVAVWLVLVLRLACLPGHAVSERRSPAILGSVAATVVLGARFAAAGDDLLAASLLGLAAAGLAWLLLPVLASLETPASGTAFLASVAVQGVAVLSADLAASYRASWLLGIASAAWLAGLVLYGVVAARFELRAVGAALGDHWVAGGALAIGTLAAGKITVSATALGVVRGWHDALAATTLALWSAAMAWLLVLAASEVIRPRVGYDVRRWATVFPVGMYAACGFSTGQVTAIGGISDFAKAWTWVAVGVTLVVLVGLVARVWTVLRETARAASA